jgi:hypothetical protein
VLFLAAAPPTRPSANFLIVLALLKAKKNKMNLVLDSFHYMLSE